MPVPDDVRGLAEQFAAGAVDPLHASEPALRDAPAEIRGYRVRLDLSGAKPPVWRQLELPGDLTLDRLHIAIQAAMGWLDGHLHRFRTSSDYRSPYFITPFDTDDGEGGVPEDEVRLDQVLTKRGDRLWYEYDFGDGWDHVIAVEAVTDEPPATVHCTAGRIACPPEDCGGIWGYTELAEWVRHGYDPASVPSAFEDADDARDWLPSNWHPDRFDINDVDSKLAAALAPPVSVAGELAELRTRLEHNGNRMLTQMLARSAAPYLAVEERDAAHLVAPYDALLDVIGDGVRLTAAGYLPPALVEQVAVRTGVTTWWIGKANREDLTAPIAQLRDSARALGLVTVRGGKLLPTAAARKGRGQPLALWRHIVSRLPRGKSDFDRQAGWMALAVVASGTPAEEWDGEIRTLLMSLGWRAAGSSTPNHFPVVSDTLDVLKLLFGKTRRSMLTGTDPAVAATAQAVIAGQALGT